jgi:hypothetical protein
MEYAFTRRSVLSIDVLLTKRPNVATIDPSDPLGGLLDLIDSPLTSDTSLQGTGYLRIPPNTRLSYSRNSCVFRVFRGVFSLSFGDNTLSLSGGELLMCWAGIPCGLSDHISSGPISFTTLADHVVPFFVEQYACSTRNTDDCKFSFSYQPSRKSDPIDRRWVPAENQESIAGCHLSCSCLWIPRLGEPD